MKKLQNLIQRIFAVLACICLLTVFLLAAAGRISDAAASLYTVSTGVSHSSASSGSAEYPFVQELTDAAEISVPAADVQADTEAPDTEPAAAAVSQAVDALRTAASGGLNLARTAKNRFVSFTDSWTDRVTDSSPLYYPAVTLSRIFDRAAGFNATTSVSPDNDTLTWGDVVVQLDNGHLAYVLDPETVTAYGAQNVASLVDFGLSMQAEGRNFLYVAVPVKMELSEYTGDITAVYPDASAELARYALDTLEAAGLDTLNILDVLQQQGMASADLYYETDHHWKASTGLYASGLLASELNARYGMQLDVSLFAPENYTITTYASCWLGSLGRKTTDVYHELEDIEVILPNYETDLTVYRSATDTTYVGSMEQTLLNWSNLTGSKNPYTYSAYAFYGYGDMACITSHNNALDDGSSLLLLKTSFADSMIPYLAAAVEDLYVVDLRYFTGSLQALLDEADPDTVAVVYNTGHLAAKSSQDHTGLFDFR